MAMDKLKLLIVDDEEGIVDMIKRTYLEKGFVTFGATDGIKAVEIYEKERPEIALIDIHMPFSPIDGIETLKRIKNIDKNAICLMVTRIDQKDKIKAAKDLGALHYIPKPFTMSELDGAVNEAADIIKKGKK